MYRDETEALVRGLRARLPEIDGLRQDVAAVSEALAAYNAAAGNFGYGPRPTPAREANGLPGEAPR